MAGTFGRPRVDGAGTRRDLVVAARIDVGRVAVRLCGSLPLAGVRVVGRAHASTHRPIAPCDQGRNDLDRVRWLVANTTERYQRRSPSDVRLALEREF